MIVVDTNVVSELMRPSPSPQVRDWIIAQAPGELCTTAVTVAEIRYGLERLPDGRRKDSLLAAATEVFAAFSEFIQPFDADAAVWYATIVAQRDRLGLPIDGFDGQIAAICRTRGAALATRNAKDFEETGIDVIDPWQQSQPADHTIRQAGRQPGTRSGNSARSRLDQIVELLGHGIVPASGVEHGAASRPQLKQARTRSQHGRTRHRSRAAVGGTIPCRG